MKDAEKFIKDQYTFEDLVQIVAYLRSENGCPWDRSQTHDSIRKNLIEECYEAVEGIDQKNNDLLKEELGDIALQVVFHAQMATEEQAFTVEDVINGICKKMVFRHPHIFGNALADNAENAYMRWEEMKKKEKGTACLSDQLERVAKTLPSLMRTQKLIKKAAGEGYISLPSESVSEKELAARYMELCALAQKNGYDLEELAYKQNEAFIEEVKKKGL